MSPEKIEIDILAMELEKKLPHWLDPTQKNPEKFAAIRERNRAKWLAQLKAEQRQKRWQRAKARAEATLARVAETAKIAYIPVGSRDFDPNQPRDEQGRWTDAGGSSGETGSGRPEGAEPAGAESPGGRPEGAPHAYSRTSPSDAQRRRNVAAVYSLDAGSKAAVERLGITPLTFHELTAEGSQHFHDTIAKAKQASAYGAAVAIYPTEDYQGMRLFLTEGGRSGFALKGDDIVSAFKHPDDPAKGFANSALALATQEGGRRLDAFDTVLPRLYSDSGFRAVARIPWNDQFAPPDWDYNKFGAFNGGRPDVVFMVYDPQHAGKYQPGDGQRVADYDVGTAAQRAVLDRLERERGVAPAAVAGYAPGVKASNDAAAVTKVKKDWIKASPITTIDQAIQLAPSVQQTLGNHGRDIAKELGGTSFEDPGPKTKSEKGIERVKEKAATRGISGVTDIARGAFVIDKPEKGDVIVEQLSKNYEVLAEAWRTLPSNYTDRAVLIRDKSGMIGEIQIMDPTMWEAKKAAHALYEEARSLPPDSARAIELNNAMRVTFGRVLDNYPPEWKAAVGRGGKSVPNTRS